MIDSIKIAAIVFLVVVLCFFGYFQYIRGKRQHKAITHFEVMYNLLHIRAKHAIDKTVIKECWSELHTVSRRAVTETHTRKCDHLRGYLMGKWQMIDPEANEIG